MAYASTYRTDDCHGRGFGSKDEYILVNSAGYYEFDPPNGLTYRKFGRVDYYLSYNHSGDMRVKIRQKNYEIGAGTVFIYAPFEEQFYEQIDRKLISNYWVHFTGYGIPELLMKSSLEPNHYYKVAVNNEIPALIEAIIDEISRKQQNFEHVSSALLQQLFFVISRKNFNVNRFNQNTLRDSRISESIEFIHKNYKDAISVTELASISGLSVSRYTSVFKETCGFSPQQYLINYRIQKAKELLDYTNLTINHIAELTGFSDQFHFSKLFKKCENLTPTNYKRKNK